LRRHRETVSLWILEPKANRLLVLFRFVAVYLRLLEFLLRISATKTAAYIPGAASIFSIEAGIDTGGGPPVFGIPAAAIGLPKDPMVVRLGPGGTPSGSEGSGDAGGLSGPVGTDGVVGSTGTDGTGLSGVGVAAGEVGGMAGGSSDIGTGGTPIGVGAGSEGAGVGSPAAGVGVPASGVGVGSPVPGVGVGVGVPASGVGVGVSASGVGVGPIGGVGIIVFIILRCMGSPSTRSNAITRPFADGLESIA
jgi:hypothetical protein